MIAWRLKWQNRVGTSLIKPFGNDRRVYDLTVMDNTWWVPCMEERQVWNKQVPKQITVETTSRIERWADRSIHYSIDFVHHGSSCSFYFCSNPSSPSTRVSLPTIIFLLIRPSHLCLLTLVSMTIYYSFIHTTDHTRNIILQLKGSVE